MLTVAGKLTWLAFARLEQFAEQEAGAGLAVDVDDGVERIEPLLRLDRVDVGQLMHEAVEDHPGILAELPMGTTGSV